MRLSPIFALLIFACDNSTAGSGGAGGSGGSQNPDAASTGGSGGAGGGGTGGSGGGGNVDGAGGDRVPDPMYLPPANGPCPEFTTGQLTFNPAGIAARPV